MLFLSFDFSFFAAPPFLDQSLLRGRCFSRVFSFFHPFFPAVSPLTRRRNLFFRSSGRVASFACSSPRVLLRGGFFLFFVRFFIHPREKCSARDFKKGKREKFPPLAKQEPLSLRSGIVLLTVSAVSDGGVPPFLPTF